MKRAWLDQQLDHRNETTRSWPPKHGQVARGRRSMRRLAERLIHQIGEGGASSDVSMGLDC
jgi:hypothetical protein